MTHRNLLGLGLALAIAVPSFARAADELKVGDPAPEFSLKGSDGKTYALSDFKGKKAVVLAWFPKAATRGCTIECKSFKELSGSLKGLDVAYFTASVDKPEDNAKFGESLSVDYPILSDPDKTVANAYGVINPARGFANRWTFYIDKEGKVAAIDKTVKVDSAAPDVAMKLKELGIADKK